jgi:hypothetical protein
VNASPPAAPGRRTRAAAMLGRPPFAARSAPGRWAAWARERAGRTGRADRRHRSARMTVLVSAPVPAPGAGGARQSFSYAAHLHLAIHPTLGQRVGGPGQTRAREPARPGPGLVIGAPGGPPRVLVLSRDATVHPPRSPGRAVRRPATSAPPAVRGGLDVLRATRSAAPMDVGGASTGVRHLRDEMVTRVVRGSKRIEMAARPAPVVQDRATAAGQIERTAAAAAVRPGGAAGQTGPHHAAAPEAVPPVDLDHLTDQIVTRLDARLIAHRERFGRGF